MNVNIQTATKNGLLLYAVIVAGALFLMIPAFYDHYPLVNPDTATYLASGFKPETPFDRPITYGLVTRLFSLNGFSLWPVIFMQAYVVAWLLFRIMGRIVKARVYIVAPAVILFLSSCTPLSWIVSQVQPDVFTPIAFLCIAALLIDDGGNRNRVLLYVIFFVAVAVHLSHPLLFCLTLALLFLLRKTIAAGNAYRTVNKKILTLLILSVSAIAIMGSAMSKSKHVFFIGSLLEKGVLKKYLDDNCATKAYKLCGYKDVLPASADVFWWDSNSPLYKTGGWKDTKSEYNDIIYNTLTQPRYLWLYLGATAKQAVTQLRTFNAGDGNTCFLPESNLSERINAYFPAEAGQFHQDKQNSDDHFLDMLWLPNLICRIVVYLSVAILVFAMARYKYMGKDMRLLLIICLSGIMLNCIDCAAFTVVNGRYGCKMIWLLPFCAILYCLQRPKPTLS